MKKAGIRSLTATILFLIPLFFYSCQTQKTEVADQTPVVKSLKDFDARAKEILEQMGNLTTREYNSNGLKPISKVELEKLTEKFNVFELL